MGWDMFQQGNPQQGDDVEPLGPICLAFSGAGLHGFYFNGVCQYIHEQDIEVQEAWGASAGALAALSVLMKVGPEAYEKVFANYDRHYNHLPWIIWHGRDFVWEGEDGGIRKFMPQGAEAEAAWLQNVVNGRLHIVVTRLSGWRFERVVVSHWTSVEDLIGCVRATMTIPGITATRPFRWRGERWVDGGFVDQHPATDNKAVLVSTSLPMQPWANSWHRHVDIFRHLPMRMSWWHGSVSGRRDMFKLGYMDAKTYFEAGFEENQRAKLVRPKARAMRFIMNLALELLQGSFMLALTVRFVWTRKQLWRSRGPSWLRLLPLWGALRARANSRRSEARLGRLLRVLGVVAELTGIAAASCLLWCTTVDLRLDLSDHLLDLATSGLGKRRISRSNSSLSYLRLYADKSPKTAAMDRSDSRRARSQPCRARRA